MQDHCWGSVEHKNLLFVLISVFEYTCLNVHTDHLIQTLFDRSGFVGDGFRLFTTSTDSPKNGTHFTRRQWFVVRETFDETCVCVVLLVYH